MSARTLGEDLRAAALAEPTRTAVMTSARTLSYAELDRASARVAGGLAAAGVERGDRVALWLANGAEMAIAVYGALRSGAAIVPLAPQLKADKLDRLLLDASPSALLCDEERAEAARSAAARAPTVRVCGAPEELAADHGPPQPPLSVDLAAVIYTSGSTGEPKGVTLAHSNMTFVADSIVEYLEMGREDRVLCVLPLSFGYGLYQLLTCVRARATLVLEPGFGLPGRIVSLLEDERITLLPGVPTVFELLLSARGFAEREFPHLRALTNAGAALPQRTVTALRSAFPGARLYAMYGQTECQRVCYLPPGEIDARPSSVGIAIPGTEAWIEDERGEIAAPGVVGELFVRGAHVMQGYWNAPEATAKRLRPGRWPWERVLATGDLFRGDEDGYLYFVSRSDEMIISRGEKVAPREVEEVLLSVPEVREAAVCGVPDRLLGEAVEAHVAPQPDAELDPGALKRACARALEEHMVPRSIVLHEELPRTANGKVDRGALGASKRAQAASGGR